jgi:hypothetical protein
MSKTTQPKQRPLPTWTIEHASTAPATRREKLALTLFIFVLLMALGFLVAAITGYVEMRSVFP